MRTGPTGFLGRHGSNGFLGAARTAEEAARTQGLRSRRVRRGIGTVLASSATVLTVHVGCFRRMFCAGLLRGRRGGGG